MASRKRFPPRHAKKQSSPTASLSGTPQLTRTEIVTIEKLIYGGDGLGRLADGRTLFVPGVASGEKVEVEVTELRRTFARGRLIRVIEPSPDRIEPLCPHYGHCGGCHLQHLSYPAQIKVKSEFIREALQRIGGFSWLEPIPIRTGPEWHYRNRTQFKLHFNPHTKQSEAGFFAAHSHRIEPITECQVLDPSLNQVLKRLTHLPSTHLSATPVVTLDLATDAAGQDPPESPSISASLPFVGLSTRPIARQVAGFHYRFDTECFFQVNSFLLDTLVKEVLSNLPDSFDADAIAVDLYAGVGLLTLPLAHRFRTVFATEAAAHTAHFAEINLGANQIANVTFQRVSTEEWLIEHLDLVDQVAFAVVDPPRAGLSPEVVDGLINLRPHHLVYVSCDPSTLARDLRRLRTGGFVVETITGIDFFPQTYHIETVVQMRWEGFN